MKAVSHPQYDKIMKKVLECVKLKILNQPSKDKFESFNWDQFLNDKKKYMDKKISLNVFEIILMTPNINEKNNLGASYKKKFLKEIYLLSEAYQISEKL